MRTSQNLHSTELSTFNTLLKHSSIVKLKNNIWLSKQRIAGKVAANALILLENEVKNKTAKSMLELNDLAEQFIISNNCTPTFKNYKGFPCGVCISVNKQLVHGIPTDYKLKDGDVVSFDLGATYEGAIADTALTCIFGEPKSQEHVRLIKVTESALMNAINSIKIGNRLGSIGNAVYKTIKKEGFNAITNYGGHGICTDNEGNGIPHASPFVPNKGLPNEGLRLCAGMSLAIEPMAIIGDAHTYVDKDGWTVCAQNINSHSEHSIFIHEDSVEIITNRN